MGLFDFVTKTKPATTAPVQNPANTAPVQQDRLVQTPFTDVKYPLPGSQQPANFSNPAPAQPLPQQQNQNNNYQQNPSTFNNYTSNYYQPSTPQSFQPAQQELKPVVETQYANTLVQPPVQEPELNEQLKKIDDFTAIAQGNESQVFQENSANLPVQKLEQQNEFLQDVFPQPAAPTQNNEYLSYNPEPVVTQTPLQTDQSLSTNGSSPVTANVEGVGSNPTPELNVNPESNLNISPETTLQNLPSVDPTQLVPTPEVQIPEIAAPQMDENNQQNVEDIQPEVNEPGSIVTGVSESEPVVTPENESVGGVDAEVSTLGTETGTELDEPKEEVKLETLDTTEVNDSSEPVSDQPPVNEVPISNEIFETIQQAAESTPEDSQEPAVESQTEVKEPEINIDETKVDETPVTVPSESHVSEVEPALPQSTEVETEKEDVISSLKVFKTVAFIGLNVEKTNTVVGDKLSSVAESLSDLKMEIMLDSTKGYGEKLLMTLGKKQPRLTFALLRPFYSDYSDESKSRFNIDNLTTAIFSNIDSKAKYMMKNADIFIVPETTGLNNLALLFLMLSNAFFYFGQHKPVVLLGKEWDKFINLVKENWSMSNEEKKVFHVCSTSEEVMNTIKQLDEEYSKKSKVVVRKMLDLRNESEETDYFVNNIEN